MYPGTIRPLYRIASAKAKVDSGTRESGCCVLAPEGKLSVSAFTSARQPNLLAFVLVPPRISWNHRHFTVCQLVLYRNKRALTDC